MDNITKMEEKKKNKRNVVVICDALLEKLQTIQAEYNKASDGLLTITTLDASKILNRLIDNYGGIKGKIKIV